MNPVLAALTGALDAPTRQSVVSRAEFLFRGIQYEEQIQTENFREAVLAGWTVGRIETLCCLNAFYHVVLGPLASATRTHLGVGLIRDIPVRYGTRVSITATDAELLTKCHQEFTKILRSHGIDFWCLQSALARDILYRLAHPPESSE